MEFSRSTHGPDEGRNAGRGHSPRRRGLWIAAMLTVFGAAGISALSLWGQETRPAPAPTRKAPRKLKEGSTCADKGCHDSLTAGKSVHRPVKKAECDACHDQEDEELHDFTLLDTGTELCYGCHDNVTAKKKQVHKPLTEAKRPCLSCHDPHTSAVKGLLRAKSADALCLTCHSDLAAGDRLHKSRAAKGCTGCHEAHASTPAKLLKAAEPKLCYTCHDDIPEEAAEAKVVHGPVAAGCVACHDPHLVGAGAGIRKAGAELCMTCHEHFDKTLASMGRRHVKLTEGAACGQCHTHHFSDRANLLTADPKALCLRCHSRDVKSSAPDGRLVKGLADIETKGMQLHGPLAQGQCGGCHEPHGNERRAFVAKAYPPKFYSPYSPEAYALCFGCHDASLAAEKATTKGTGFRNGTSNLHYVHVNKARKGRSCRSCHSPHATKNSHMLADSVRFGSWDLPIGFKETATGGTCASGCHAPKSYSRGPAPAPATVPAPPPRRARKSE